MEWIIPDGLQILSRSHGLNVKLLLDTVPLI